jgi:hypothetical protein
MPLNVYLMDSLCSISLAINKRRTVREIEGSRGVGVGVGVEGSRLEASLKDLLWLCAGRLTNSILIQNLFFLK